MAEDAIPPPHAYQAMTAMADQALRHAMDTESIIEIAAALEEHHLYCHSQLVREARVLRDRLKKAAKKAKKQMQSNPPAVVATEVLVEAAAPCDESRNDNDDEMENICDMLAAMPGPEPQENSTMADDDAFCVICLEVEKSHLLAPCGHRCLCGGCAGRVVFPYPCPICRRACAAAVSVDPAVGF